LRLERKALAFIVAVACSVKGEVGQYAWLYTSRSL